VYPYDRLLAAISSRSVGVVERGTDLIEAAIRAG
jgi:hypothetical protein